MKQEIEHYTNRAGGKGTMHIERLLTPKENGKSCENVCTCND